MRPAALTILIVILLLSAACDLENDGDTPPLGTLYFPNALDLLGEDADSPPRFLLVTNSNFDLRFNAGTLQAYDLEALAESAARCAASGGDRDCILDPCQGRPASTCKPLASLPPEEGLPRLLADEVLIGSFSNGIGLSPEYDKAFIATRTDASLTVVELDPSSDDDVFRCGSARDCTTRAGRGPDPETGKVRSEWPGDPMAVLARPLSDWIPGDGVRGNYVLVAHAGASMSLFIEQFDGAEPNGEYELVSELYGIGGLPVAFTAMAYDAASNLVHLSYILGSNSGKGIMRVGVSVPTTADGTPDLRHAAIFSLGNIALDGVGPRSDTRDLTFIDHGTPAPENRALVLSREPNALLLADVDESRNRPGIGRVTRIAPLGSGPSRLVVGELDGETGPLRIAAIACFSARELFIVDLDTMLVRTVIPNFSGPFDLALDASRNLLYVSDFRSSVIRVVDLSPLTDPSAGEGARVIATLGSPRVIQELQ